MKYSDLLTRRYILYKKAKREWKNHSQTPKLKDIITEFRNNRMLCETDPYLFWCSDRDLIDAVMEEYEYEYCINPELRNKMKWATEHILNMIGIDNYITVHVYIRIFTSMLNKLVDEGIISKEIGIYYHDNLVRNTMSLISDLSTEDLPF